MIIGQANEKDLRACLLQMLAALRRERQALAGLDVEEILGCVTEKRSLCASIEGLPVETLDGECRGMIETARRLNEVNQQIRNLVAANVAARLDMLVEQGSGLARSARYHVDPDRMRLTMIRG